jgi:hypothetical protein
MAPIAVTTGEGPARERTGPHPYGRSITILTFKSKITTITHRKNRKLSILDLL